MSTPAQRRCVFLVEPDEALREVLLILFSSSGFDVVFCPSAADICVAEEPPTDAVAVVDV